jgi:hypothetical protein
MKLFNGLFLGLALFFLSLVMPFRASPEAPAASIDTKQGYSVVDEINPVQPAKQFSHSAIIFL